MKRSPRRLAKEESARSARGEFVGLGEERLTFHDLVDLIERDYRINNHTSADNLRGKIKVLEFFFGTMRSVQITPAVVTKYISA